VRVVLSLCGMFVLVVAVVGGGGSASSACRALGSVLAFPRSALFALAHDCPAASALWGSAERFRRPPFNLYLISTGRVRVDEHRSERALDEAWTS